MPDFEPRLHVDGHVLVEQWGRYTCGFCGNTYRSRDAAQVDAHACTQAPRPDSPAPGGPA